MPGKLQRHRLTRLIRAFKTAFPNAPPGLGQQIMRSSFAAGGAARRCQTRSPQFVVQATAVAWLRHHRTDYEQQMAQAATQAEKETIRRAANRQARAILKSWQ